MERRARNKEVHSKMNENAFPRGQQIKRAGDENIVGKMAQKKSRRAFGDITNQEKITTQGGKKAIKKSTKTNKKDDKQSVAIPRTVTGSLSNSQQDRSDTSWDIIELSQPSSQISSQESSSSFDKAIELSVDDLTLTTPDKTEETLPVDFEDVDKDVDDPFQVPLYAHSIFEYLKERERKFEIPSYLSGQKDLNSNMRAILVDWLVEVQENFELNHETLYLAVKLVDHYLKDNQMTRDKLQLVGAVAMFIACKYDERMPPVLDDFLYICDDAYTRDQLLTMERHMLKSVGFDLGFPLSYSFLRRFSKCGKCDLQTLTLSRFILEMSLMEYKFVPIMDSKMAASALFLAMKMKDKSSQWDRTLEYYTSYKQEELLSVVQGMSNLISAVPSKQLATIRTKYSHSVFHEVAKIPTLTSEEISQFS